MVLEFNFDMVLDLCWFGNKFYYGDLIWLEMLCVVGGEFICVYVVILDDLDVNMCVMCLIWCMYFNVVVLVCVCNC